jgi:D-sedoheptulose 7-phosphate isomerase
LNLQETEIHQSIQQRLTAYAQLPAHVSALVSVVAAIRKTLVSGGRVFTCGNGGSAAEALHLSEEMIGRFTRTRKALAATCLSADPTALTCIANDFGYENVFSRQLEGLAKKGDVLVALSTSGKSANILRALETARALGLIRIGLLGPSGSPAEALCDHAVTLRDALSAHIQEMHLIAIHLILEQLDADA